MSHPDHINPLVTTLGYVAGLVLFSKIMLDWLHSGNTIHDPDITPATRWEREHGE